MHYSKIGFLILSLSVSGITQARISDNKPANQLTNVNFQSIELIGTLSSSSRLFKTKDDLTSVIMIIPSGSSVAIVASDSTYYKVIFEENEGFIFRKHVTIDKTATIATALQEPQKQAAPQVQQQVTQQNPDRFSRLENKYGTTMATRIYQGKIWKGMNSEMVRDSWGRAIKINRVVNGNVIQEEWLYSNTWLYIENNTLVDWGPVKKQQ